MSSNPQCRLYLAPEAVPLLQAGQEVECSGDQAHYLSRVLRLGEGAALAVFNQRDGEWLVTLTQRSKQSVRLRCEYQRRAGEEGPDVWACFAPLKFGRIDYLAQKLTELGVSRLQPVYTRYTQSDKVNLKRLRANAVEAAEQCERVAVPAIAEPVRLMELLAEWPSERVLILADESGQGHDVRALQAMSAPKSWAILIGPEGGFSDEERETLYAQPNITGVSLGPRILRADTAAVSLLTLTMSWWGDWHIAPHFQADKVSSDCRRGNR